MLTSSRHKATNQCAAKTSFMQVVHVLQYNLQSFFRSRVAQGIGAASNNSVACLAGRTNAVPGMEESAKAAVYSCTAWCLQSVRVMSE